MVLLMQHRHIFDKSVEPDEGDITLYSATTGANKYFKSKEDLL